MSKKKKVLLIVGIIVVVVVGLGWLGLRALSRAAQNMVMVDDGIPVQSVSTRDLSSVIYASGTIESQNKVSVTTDLTGQVKELYVHLGDYVEAGTPLLLMDDTEIRQKISDLEKQLSEQDILEAKQKEINQRNLNYAKQEQSQTLSDAQNAINQAQNQVNQATAALEAAEKNYQSYLSSEEPDSEVLEQLQAAQDDAKSALDSAKSMLNEAQSSYNTAKRSTDQTIQSAQDTIDTQGLSSEGDKTAQSTLTDLYAQLAKVSVTAPQSGIITSLNVSVGSMVTNGDLMVIQDSKNLKLNVSIPESDILKVQSGMHAVIKSDAIEDVEMNGTVNKVINFSVSSDTSTMMGEGSSSGGSYSAEILIEGETQLLLGMTAKAEIVLTEKKDAISVPYDSIVKEDDDTYVYIAESAEGDMYTVKKVSVKPGEEGDYYTEITSDNLKEGDLVVSYPDMVTEGESIHIFQFDDEEEE